MLCWLPGFLQCHSKYKHNFAFSKNESEVVKKCADKDFFMYELEPHYIMLIRYNTGASWTPKISIKIYRFSTVVSEIVEWDCGQMLEKDRSYLEQSLDSRGTSMSIFDMQWRENQQPKSKEKSY